MRRRREYDRYPLWKNSAPLVGIDPPRLSVITQGGFPERPDGRHQGWSFLATERRMHEQRTQEIIRDHTANVLNLDAGAWAFQRPFFIELFSRFFGESRDNPAWVVIAPQRITIHHRQQRGHVVETSPGDAFLTTRGHELRKYPLRLGGLEMPSDDLLLAPRLYSKVKDTRVAHQLIQRDLKDWRGDTLFRIHEEWCYLATGDGEDLSDMAAGRIPSMRQFIDTDARIQTAAHIALCKLSGCREYIEAISFDLHPHEPRLSGLGVPGQVLAFRWMIYPLEFYMRTDLNNHRLLQNAVTRGGWEPL